MPENREMLFEELSPEQQQEALANLTSAPAQPEGFDPVDILSPSELAELSVQSKGKDFDPVQWGASNPQRLEDPNTVAKLADTYGLLKQRGFKFKDIDLAEATKGVLQIFPSMAKWAGTALELGVVNPVLGAVTPDLRPDAQAEFEKLRAKKSAELVASTELGVTGLAEMAKKGGEKVSRLFGFSKDPDEQDPAERVNDFWGAVGMAQQRQKIAEGGGTATQAVLGGALEQAGVRPDPETVNELAAGDPVTFLAFPGGFKLVSASGKFLGRAATRTQAVQIVTRLRQAQKAAARAATAEKATIGSLERVKQTVGEMTPTGQALAQPILTEAGQVATQASRLAETSDQALRAAEQAFNASRGAQVVAGAQQLAGRLVEPLAAAREAVGGAVTRGTDIALGVGAGATGAALRTVEGVGKGIAAFIPPIATPRALRVGYELAGKAGRQQFGVAKQLVTGAREGFSPSLRLLSDVARSAPTVAAGAGRGFAMLDVPLAAVSSETPTDTAHMAVFGTFLGALGAGARGAGRVVQGQTIAPRAWGSDAAMRDYRSFSGLDEAHKFSVESANDPAKAQWLSAIREFLKPTGAQLYVISDKAMFEDALRRYAPGAEEAWYQEAANQRGVNLKMVDDAGKQQKVILLRDAKSAPHEAFHPLQDVLGKEAMEQIDQLIYDEYAPVWDQLGQNYVRQFKGERGLADYLSRGENWQEAILDITSGGTKWRETLTPEQIDQVANLYLSRELSAEVGDAILRASGPSLLENPSFPGKLARILGKTMVGLGVEPFEGVRTEGQSVPLRMEPTQQIQEAFRTGIETLKVEQRRPDLRQVPPYPQRGGGTTPPRGPTPTEPAAPTEPIAPVAAAEEARTIANEAPDVAARGQRSPREILGEIAETIASGEGIVIDYRSAPGEPAGAVTSNRTARRAIIEAFRTMPQSARALWEKQFFPDRVIRTQGGKIQVQGWAPEVFAANAHKMAKALSEGKAADLSPYEIDPNTGTFTEAGWKQLYDDTKTFVQNQLAGQTGAGEPLVVPASVVEQGFTQPARRGEAGGALEQPKADFINALFGVKLPATPRIGRVFPRNIAGQEVSEATLPGRTSVPVEPRAPFAGARAEELGIAGRQIREVNPFRAELARRKIAPSLIEAVQRLNLESIADVSAPGAALPQFRGVEFTLQAGFQPKPRDPRAIKSAAIRISGPEGERVVEGVMHVDAYEKAFGKDLIPRDVVVTDGFVSNDGKFFDREAAFNRATELNQITPESETAQTRMGLESELFRAERKFQPRALEDTVAEIRDADMPSLRELVKNVSGRFGGGLTGFAYDLGAGLKEPAQLRTLEDARAFHASESKKALAARDFDAAAINGNKAQLFREAIEFSTGEGSAGNRQAQEYPGFEPPLRGRRAEAQPELIGGQFQPATARMADREHITAAAIRMPDGTVHEGMFHGMAYQNARVSPIPENRPIAQQAIEEGFVAVKNGKKRFVGREEAFRIGKQSQQIEAGSPAESTAKFLALSDERPALESFSFQESRRFQPKPNKDVESIAKKYAKRIGFPYEPSEQILTPKPDVAKKIADFYETAKSDPANKEVAESYDALVKETMDQWRAIEDAGYKLEPFEGKGEPYKNSDEMMADVRDNKHLYFLKTSPETLAAEAGNPLLETSGIEGLVVNDVFRAVHDFFGHAKEGYQFGPKGELNAWRAHSEMYSPEAQGALAAETLAQNSWVNFGKHLRDKSGKIPAKGEEGYVPPTERPFAPQKNIVIPEELIAEARGQAEGGAKFQPAKEDFKMKTGVAGNFSKGWLLPSGEVATFGGKFHRDWLADNVEDVSKRFGLDKDAIENPTEEGTRPEELALGAGFARVNLGLQNGALTIELRASDLRKHKAAIRTLVEENAPLVDKITVALMDDKVQTVLDKAAETVFTLKDSEKAEHIPFVSGSIEPRLPGAAAGGETRRREPTMIQRAREFSVDPDALAKFQPKTSESELQEIAEIEKAEKYFSIGHDTEGSRVWIWDSANRTVRDADGVKFTHGTFVSHEVADRTFKGRYDPESEVVSVVFPARLKPADREVTVDDIPTGIYNALRRKYRPTSFAVFQPRGETEGLPGLDVPREVLSASARAQMTRQELRQHFPEAVVPRAGGESLPSDIVGSPLYKRAGDETTAVEQFAKRLVDFAREYESSPEFEAGKKWYSDFTPKLKKAFGKDAQLMAELLAATSPNTGVETNFGYAFDALKSWQSGRFNKIIPKFEEGLEKIGDGSWESWYNRELKAGNIAAPPANPTPAAFLARWIERFDLKPKQSNGKLYGQHSIPVLQVFARRWLDLNTGPKTRNFVENLLGQGDEATIDVWADRTMRWAGYEGLADRWRILPENKSGVSDADFAFSQKAFRAAAEELGMKPSDLQGALWFAEKRRWADKGWGRLDLGDFREEMKKIPLLERGIEQRLKASGVGKKKKSTPEAEQLGLAVEPRFR